MPTPWWLQILTIAEVEQVKSTASLAQLATYVRQIFMDQLDRRFVLALILGGDELHVHLFDRSGIVSTLTPINIHEVGLLEWIYLCTR